MKKLVLAWAATVVAATGASVAMLGLIGTGLTGAPSHVLSQAEVRGALATATTRAAAQPSATPSAAATPGASPAQGKLIRSAGGTVIASCDGDLITLRSWTPAQDYSVDDVERGPAREAKVEFEPAEGEEVELKLGCSGGQPVTLHR
ncbi:hypothetical protein ABZ897_13730 [Nonomuraea sp. NPDC046802]|uniref:hypothetical protein n=1 Tax=Nonomuraea sp. NPDC046802 TaxID=3154919 RepID=UPI0033F45678